MVPLVLAALLACSQRPSEGKEPVDHSSAGGRTEGSSSGGTRATGGNAGTGGMAASGGQTSGGGLSGAGGAQCGSVMLAAQGAEPEEKEGVPPVPEGGQIREGTYDAVAFEYYGKLPQAKDYPYHRSFEISGTEMHLVQGVAGTSFWESYEISTSGTTFTMTRTCPTDRAGSRAEQGYTASESELVFFAVSGSDTEVLRYAKRSE